MRTSAPVVASHTRTALSHPLLARNLPSGLHATPYTFQRWPRSILGAVLPAPSQSQLAWSHSQLATVRPSGLQATAHTRPVCPESVSRTRPLATSQNLTVPFQLPLARVRPSGVKASVNTQSVCPMSIRTPGSGCAPEKSHSRIWVSKPPLASRLPSGLQARAYTGPLWPVSVRRCVPLWASKSWMTASAPLLASVRPSGAKARRWMLLVCQLVQSRAPLSNSHSLMAPSQLAVASVPPSGLKVRVATVLVCACQARCRSFPSSRQTRTSPSLLPAAQYCPLRLVATAQMASRAEVQTVSSKVAPESFVSCISTPCRDAPRMTSCDRFRPRRCPRSSRSSASRLAGP